MGTNLQPLRDSASPSGRQGGAQKRRTQLYSPEPAVLPPLIPLKEMELGCVETSNFKGRDLQCRGPRRDHGSPGRVADVAMLQQAPAG